jgi:hypothetical protein
MQGVVSVVTPTENGESQVQLGRRNPDDVEPAALAGGRTGLIAVSGTATAGAVSSTAT